MKYLFKLSIGDPSGNGHGKTSEFVIRCSHDLHDVVKAYQSSVELLGRDFPGTICQHYEETEVSFDDAMALWKAGYFPDKPLKNDDTWMPWADEMCDLTVWFLRQGNPDIKYEILNISNLSWRREIPPIGYGIFH